MYIKVYELGVFNKKFIFWNLLIKACMKSVLQ